MACAADTTDSDSSVDFEEKSFRRAYRATESVTTMKDSGEEVVVDYSRGRLSSSMLFCTTRGTVFRNKAMWLEQAVVGIIFCSATYTSWALGVHADTAAKFAGSFADKVATLAAFLLGFYTSLTVSRWWRLRTSGIGNIWSASSQLTLFLSQFVTRDEQVLSAIRRYARASLTLIFLKRRYAAKLPHRLGELVDREILTEDEVQKLKAWNNNLAESVWTWVAHLLANLYESGEIKSDMMLTFLLERVNLGRSGAALIGAQMSTPIPMPYVHLLGWLVKVHNIVLGICYGYLCDHSIYAHHHTRIMFLMAKAFFIPFLYNSLLVVNATLADPFNGEMNGFPLKRYEMGIESDGLSYLAAGNNLPEWMKKRV